MMWLFWSIIILILLIGLTCLIMPLREARIVKQVPAFLLLPILLPSAAIPLYFVWGDSHGLSAYYQQQDQSEEVEAFMQEYQDPQQIITMLENRLGDSGDSTGWFLLGRLYSSTENYDEAADAFGRANRLDPNNPEIMMQYTLALYFANGNTLNTESKALLDELIANDPNNPDVLNLLALDAYQRKDYETAIAYWRRLLAMFSSDPQAQQVLMASIAQAQQALEDESGTQQIQTVKLDVSVALSEELTSRVSPDQTVFVYARAQDGPPMPIAIVRRRVTDLPFEVTLDDSTSIMSALHLSDFTQVIIYARVSQHGQAETELGDLIGSSDIINLSESNMPVKITIDKVIDAIAD